MASATIKGEAAVEETADYRCEESFVLCRTLQLQQGDINAAAPSVSDAEHTHKLAYRDWTRPRGGGRGSGDGEGETTDEEPRVLIAVHGLTRNSRDFDDVAKTLVKDGYRVIAVDMPGRWNSDRLPSANYGYPQYIHDVKTLVHTLGLRKVDWLGTSMGGLIGILVASQQDPQDTHPFEIGKFIINDIGPFVPAAGLARLTGYVGKDVKFRSFEEVVNYVKDIAKPFGCRNEEEWEKISKYYVRPIADHATADEFKYELHYDPTIASSIPNDPTKLQNIDLWRFWEHVKCGSLLLLRGVESDILLKEVSEEMVKKARFPMRMHEFAGVGHAPALVSDDQIQVIRHFLQAGPASED